MLGRVGLSDDVTRIAAAAGAYAHPGEEVAAVLPAEPAGGELVYLCGFEAADGTQSWLALDDQGSPVLSRKVVRDAASIAALCEIAEESVEGSAPVELRVASPSYLDSVGAAAHNGEVAAAIQGALPAVEELAKAVESNYKLQLS
jgi:hypothetical protein